MSDGPWFAVHFDLDAGCWGFVLEHEDTGFYAYDESTPAPRRVVPCFSRFEHACLFARQWPQPASPPRGGDFDLAPTLAYATQRGAPAPADLEDTWWFLIEVAKAAGLADTLLHPGDEPPSPEALRECLDAFRLALRQLDR